MSKINNPKIKVTVKRVQYQEITISEYEGYEMPETLTKLFELGEDVKRNIEKYVLDDWAFGEYEITDFDVSINSEEK